jgi:acetate kinase
MKTKTLSLEPLHTMDAYWRAAKECVIFAETSRISMRVIHTDKEWMIAKTVCLVSDLPREREYDHENKKNI